MPSDLSLSGVQQRGLFLNTQRLRSCSSRLQHPLRLPRPHLGARAWRALSPDSRPRTPWEPPRPRPAASAPPRFPRGPEGGARGPAEAEFPLETGAPRPLPGQPGLALCLSFLFRGFFGPRRLPAGRCCANSGARGPAARVLPSHPALARVLLPADSI